MSSTGDLLLLSELFLAQLLRDLECRNSPFEFVSFFFPSGCFFFGKIVMISKRESDLFRRSFHRTTTQARQTPASCCFMTSIYGMRENARTYGTSRRNAQLTTWDLGRILTFEGSRKFDLHCNFEAFNRPFARWRSNGIGWLQLPEFFASILAPCSHPRPSKKLPRTGNELKLSEDKGQYKLCNSSKSEKKLLGGGGWGRVNK